MDPEKMQQTIQSLTSQLEQANAARATAEARADAAEANLKATTTRADVAEGKLSVVESKVTEVQAANTNAVAAAVAAAVAPLQERADKAEQLVTRFDATMEAAVQERATIVADSRVVLGADFKFAGLTNDKIRREVVLRLDAAADVSDKVTEAKVQGIYEARIRDVLSNARSLSMASSVLGSTHLERPATRQDAIAKNRERTANAWRTPLSNDPRNEVPAAGKGQ